LLADDFLDLSAGSGEVASARDSILLLPQTARFYYPIEKARAKWRRHAHLHDDSLLDDFIHGSAGVEGRRPDRLLSPIAPLASAEKCSNGFRWDPRTSVCRRIA
jgi:hypothetical protein